MTVFRNKQSALDAKRDANISEWNKALEAAAKLVGTDGFTFVRRYMDHATMSAKVEVMRGNHKVKGEYDEATHVAPDDMVAAAILSLRR